mgnify:CR=1 FL=1
MESLVSQAVRYLVAGANKEGCANCTLHEENNASRLESKFGVDLHLDKKISKVLPASVLRANPISNKGSPRRLLVGLDWDALKPTAS